MTVVIDKAEAHRLVDELPDDATWEDFAYLAYLHGKLARGQHERNSGTEIPHDEVFRRFTDPPPLTEAELASIRRGSEQLDRGEWVIEDGDESGDSVDCDR